MRRKTIAAVAAVACAVAGCAQVFGIDQVNEVPADASVTDSTHPGEASAADVTTDSAVEATSEAAADGAADARDANSAADAGDAADAAVPLDADAAADAADAATDAGPDCTAAPLYPSTGSVFCLGGADGGPVECPAGVEQCCYGGGLDGGGFAPSTCDPLGTTCTNGNNPKTIQCADPTDCPDGGQCCAQFSAATVDSCGNLKANLNHMLCESACSTGEVAVCESPVVCAAGMQCLPIKASGIFFAYCANSSFTISPPVVSFPTVAVGSSMSGTGTVTNNSSSAQLVNVVIAGKGPSPFAFTSNGCTGLVPVGMSCSLTLTFAPTAPGNFTATAVVSVGGVPVATGLATGTGQ